MIFFKNRFGEIRSFWPTLVGLLFYSGIVFFSSFFSSFFARRATSPLFSGEALSFCIYVFLNCLLFLTLFFFTLRVFYGVRPGGMGFADKHWLRNLLLGLAIGAGTMALLIAALLLSGQLSFLSFSPSALFVPDYWLYLAVFVFVAIGEETFARGFLCTALKPSRQKWFIVLFPSLFFAAMHLSNSGMTFLPFFNLILGGIWFCLLFVRSGSLWLSIGAHFAWNVFQGQVFGTQVSGNETPSLFVMRQTGSNPLFTGGAFGPEGSLLSTGVLLVFILVLLFTVKTSPHASWTFESGLPFLKNKNTPAAEASEKM